MNIFSECIKNDSLQHDRITDWGQRRTEGTKVTWNDKFRRRSTRP